MENQQTTPEKPSCTGSTEAPCYAFINLSNGIEALTRHGLQKKDCRFLRIQSTACEQKRWEDILNGLSPDFLLLAAMGENICVYDYGARKNISRAVWQGLEWIKYVLYLRWCGTEYLPEGRAKSMQPYFDQQYFKLSKKTKRMLDYYRKFAVGTINIHSITAGTLHDGDVSKQRKWLMAA